MKTAGRFWRWLFGCSHQRLGVLVTVKGGGGVTTVICQDCHDLLTYDLGSYRTVAASASVELPS